MKKNKKIEVYICGHFKDGRATKKILYRTDNMDETRAYNKAREYYIEVYGESKYYGHHIEYVKTN